MIAYKRHHNRSWSTRLLLRMLCSQFCFLVCLGLVFFFVFLKFHVFCLLQTRIHAGVPSILVSLLTWLYRFIPTCINKWRKVLVLCMFAPVSILLAGRKALTQYNYMHKHLIIRSATVIHHCPIIMAVTVYLLALNSFFTFSLLMSCFISHTLPWLEVRGCCSDILR